MSLVLNRSLFYVVRLWGIIVFRKLMVDVRGLPLEDHGLTFLHLWNNV